MKKSIRTSTFKPHSQCLALESRLVFDGAMAATVADVQPDNIDKPITDNTSAAAPVIEPPVNFLPEKPASVADFQPSTDSPAFFIEPNPLELMNVALTPVMDVKGDISSTVIVVDPRADTAAALLANPPTNTQILTLDTSRDGFQQVADYLQTRHDVADLHLLTWTDGFSQWLGNKALTGTIESSVSNQLALWGDGLTDKANIVFHGVDKPSTGWLNYIDALTGAATSWSQDDIDQTTITPPRTEIVFIENNIADYQTLLNGVNPNAEVYVLDSTKDGLAQIARILAGRTGIEAISIISHGSEASLGLGSMSLTTQNLQDHAADLTAIGSALSQNADILLYGCDVAAGSDGAAFIAALAQATQADIAASTDVTGVATKGGNWALEVKTGFIEASIPFTTETLSNYAYVLPAGMITFDGFDSQYFGFDNIATDGEIGSADIAGIVIQIFAIAGDNSIPITTGGSLRYHSFSNPTYGQNQVTWDDDAGNPFYGMNIKSSDGSNFRLQSVNFIDWGMWDGHSWMIEALDNGVYKGAATFNGSTSGNYVGLVSGGVLTSAFDNIDEVRIHNTDRTKSWFGINDIFITNPVISNTAPTFTGGANTGLTVLEDAATTTITNAMLNVTDAEQAASALTYTLVTASTKGVLSAGSTFTQADINNGLIKYTPNLNANGSDSFTFSVSDGVGGTVIAQTFNFTITPVADVNIVAGITPVEGATGTFTITLDSASASNLTINYTLVGTATLMTDYTVTAGAGISAVTAGTFTILAGQTTATLNVNALTDALTNPNERVILTLAAGAGYQLPAGTLSYAAKVDYGIGTAPYSVTTGDFNGDGKLDMAVANINLDTVSVFLRNAANTGFDAKVDYGTGAGPYSVTTGDFNGDGKLDMAVANYSTNTVSVLLRNAANTGFDAKVDYATGTNAASVTTGDFNGDGKLDMAVANRNSNTVSVLLRNAANTGFDAKVDYSTGTDPYSVTTGDFNGDGKLDMAVANRNSDTVSVLLRNAANTGFDAKVDVGTGVNPFSVTTGDFNGDGKLDMAVANFGSHTVSVLLRNAANTGFDAKVDVGTGANPRSVITGDFNNDGKLDMAVANGNSNTVSVLLRNAANTGFDVKADYGTGTAPFSMTTGDFNGDGTLDMAAANFGSHTVSVLLNTLPSATLTITDVLPNTAPTFTGGANTGLTVLEDAAITTITTAMLNVTDAEQAASALTYTLTTASTKGVLSKSGAALGVGSTFTQADINSGIIKYTPNFNVNGSDSVGFSVSDGAGGSLTAQTFNFTLTPVADVNITAGITPVEGVTGTFTITLDSAPAADLVMNYTLSASTATLTTDYTVTAGAGIGAVTAGTFIILAGQTTATLNINALTDAVTDPNETVILTLATGVGYQLAATPSSAFEPIVHVFTSANPASVTTGDFNGDGKLDMAVANWGANTVSVLLRNAANTGFDANDFATGASPYSVTTGDFNGDGKLDMAVANFDANTVSVLLRNAANTGFDAKVDVATGVGPISVTTGDFNGDGKLDMAVANRNANTVSVLLRNAANTGFDAKVDVATGVGSVSVTTGDFNGDGKLDMAVANGYADTVSVLLRNATNTGFDAKVDFVTGASPYSVTTGDFNGDGKLDMAVANFDANTVSVLLRNAANTGFDAKVDVVTDMGSISVTTGDFNGDGKLDMAVANYFANTMSVLLRNAANTGFNAKVDYGAGVTPYSVTTGDFNGDGKLDMAVANWQANTVSVLLNNADPSATLTITDVLPNTAPTLGGTFTTAGAVNDNATTTPFSNVTVSDIENNNVSITITYAAANGTLTGAGLTGSAGNYTLTSASLATVQSNLRALVFTPTANQVAVGLTVQTTFTLTPNDGTVNGTPNATTSVTATSINDAPTATNLNTPETYTEDTALNLTDIVISDVDIVSSNVYTAILTLSNTAAGSLSTATSGAVTSTYNAGTGVWSASGSKADVNALLAGVTFNPALNFNGSFNIATSISDGIALAVTGTKALTGIAVNDAPSYISDTVLSISNGVLLSSGDLTTTRPTLEADILWDGTGSGSPFLIYNGNPVSSGYGLIGQILANGTMDVYIVVGGVTVNPVANIAANTWTHIGISLDASGNYQYAVGSATGAIALPLPNLQDTTVSIANSLTGVFPMNGQVDNVAIWNAALTSTQMASHGLLVGNEANLAGLWKLENNFSNSVAGGQALTASGSTSFIAIPLPQLASIAEDATPSSSGTTIANLILAISVADADHDKLGGLAITGNNANASTQGSWQYYNGTSWTNISVTVSLTNALQLNTSTALRFIPVANYNGTPDSLSAYLIDNSITFTNASLIDLTGLTGGINHYSASTVTLGINVIAVNDAPVGVGNLTLAAVNENTLSPAGAAINSLVGLNFTDVDAGAFLKGVAVVGSGDGNWQYSTNGATNWYSIGTVSLANTLVLAPTTLVRYLPLPNYTGTPPALQVKALDDTYAGSFSSTAGAETRVTLDATVNGGATAIANASNTISTSVTDVNPVIANATASLNENSVAGTTVTTVTASNDTNGLIYSITGGNTDVDGDGNLAFSINASTGAITVNDADDLNFETTPTFSLTVAVDDEDADTTADSTATITVNLQNLDEVAPTITSSATATAINENSGAGQVIYTATSTDVTDYVSGTTAYSLSGTDAALFTINSSTGAVTLTTNPNFEAKASYSFNVVATDAANNASSKAVTLAINNLDEVAPTITSSATATAINENSGAAQVIYTATSTDVTDYVSGTTAYSLSGTDAALFSINSTSGAVTLTANPNFETKASYSFNVIATDAANNASTQAVTLAINDLNEAPSVTSGGTLGVAENSTGTVYTATGTDPDTAQTLSWTISGTDAALFSINSTSGALTFNTLPNFEIPTDNGGDNVYDLTVIATDNGTGNLTASKTLIITVTNVNEAPTTSAPFSISVIEDVASALTGISFADVDAGSSSVTATLAVNSGTLSATSGGSVTVTGSGTASMTLAGTLTNINAFIASSAVSFTTALNSISNVTLSSSLNDNGNSGSGGALSSAVSATTLTVTGIADTPSVASPTINEDIDSGAIAITRNAADGAEVTHYKITSITGGTLYSDAGFTTAISADSFIASSGATTNVYFRPAADFNGAAGFTVQGSSSNLDAGLGGNTATSTITVNPVNDAPTGLGNLTLLAVDEDTVSPAGAAINTLARLNFTDVDAGASLSGVAVIANTANANTQGVWQYSTNGTNWYNIGTVTGNSAVALSATSLVRFVPALNFNGTPPSLTVRALDNTYAEGFTNGAVLVTTNANINGGSSGISANTNTISTSIAAVNDAPVWSGLANTVNFTEDSAAVALGSAITLSDVDLNSLSYADSTLTLVRNGNANVDDVFANTGTLGALTQGGNLTVNGIVIGTITSNSAGLLTLTFNANATKALVNSALQQITYSNSSNTPPPSVQIMWLFNDNNTGAQGKGAAFSVLRSTTVTITPTNDAPIAVNDNATLVNSGTLSGSPLVQQSSGNVVFLNNLSVLFDNFLTSGSLILLSNLNNDIDSDSSYLFKDKRQLLDHDYRGDYALPPVHLSLYVPLRYHIISVAGVLPQQTLIAQEFYVFKIPNWLFQHRNPYETLNFTATHLDGTALPEWIKLNPKTLTFFGLAPKGAQDVRVMMTIGDQYGNKVHSVFTIHVTDKVPAKNVVGEQRRAVGKSGFTEQLYSAGKVSKLHESRRLLDSLNHL